MRKHISDKQPPSTHYYTLWLVILWKDVYEIWVCPCSALVVAAIVVFCCPLICCPACDCFSGLI